MRDMGFTRCKVPHRVLYYKARYDGMENIYVLI